MERPDPTPTLGERLDAEARVLLARARHSFGWSGGFQVLAAHLVGLTAAAEGRFGRVEVTPGAPGIMRAAPAARLGPAMRPADWPLATLSPPALGQPGAAPFTSRPQASGGTDRDRGSAGAGPESPALPRMVPADVRRRLREVAGPGADVMRVHDDSRADAIARAHAADAVTIGADAYFRQGRLAPDDQRGQALLAHEASHVSSSLRLEGTPRRTPGSASEEALALARERAVLAGIPAFPRPPGEAPPAVPLAASAIAQAAQAAPQPSATMRAATDRDTGGEATPGVDLEALRRSVVDDLMRRLRTEFERGG